MRGHGFAKFCLLLLASLGSGLEPPSFPSSFQDSVPLALMHLAAQVKEVPVFYLQEWRPMGGRKRGPSNGGVITDHVC